MNRECKNIIQYVYLQNETCCDGEYNYSIRGKCTSKFYAETVRDFLKKHKLPCKKLRASQLVSGEWVLIITAPSSLYIDLFENQHRYIIAQVPSCEEIQRESDKFGLEKIEINEN